MRNIPIIHSRPKIFEYLASYKPIVTFKLGCYPKELDELLIYPSEISGSALFKSINIALIKQATSKNLVDGFLSNFTKEAVANKIINLVEDEK